MGNGHEATSQEYIKILLGKDEPFDKKEWEFADHVASAADRTSFPLDYRSFKVNFRDDPAIKHPNSGKEFDLDQFKTVEPEELKKKLDAANLSVRVLADALNTSPSQVVRLLQENTGSKQLAQLFKLAEVAGYEVQFNLRKKRAA